MCVLFRFCHASTSLSLANRGHLEYLRLISLTYIYIIFGYHRFRNHRRPHRHPKLAKKIIFSNRNHLYFPPFLVSFLASGKRKSNLSNKWTNLIAEQDAIVAPSIHSYSLSLQRECAKTRKKDKTFLEIILSLSFLLSFVFSVIAFAFGFDSFSFNCFFFLLVGCIGWQPTTMEEKKRNIRAKSTPPVRVFRRKSFLFCPLWPLWP